MANPLAMLVGAEVVYLYLIKMKIEYFINFYYLLLQKLGYKKRPSL